MSFDLYQVITDRIIAAPDSGTVPWHKPRHCTGGAISRATGKPYSVLNQMLLHKTGEYVTFKQAMDEGRPVKKGEKSSMVFFFKFLDVKDNCHRFTFRRINRRMLNDMIRKQGFKPAGAAASIPAAGIFTALTFFSCYDMMLSAMQAKIRRLSQRTAPSRKRVSA